jgi:DNA invertase Pin-like site-specific DNA recombinase
MTKGKRIGYIRVSTIDQHPERQLLGIELDKKFVEFASGKNINRPELKRMIDYAREDDIIYVHSLDRLARNIKDLRSLIDEFIQKKIKIHFIQENLIFGETNSHISNLLLMIIGSIAEFEVALIRERQLEGIALAKKAGKYKGRKKLLTKEKSEYIKLQLSTTRKSKNKIAAEIGVCRLTLYKYIKELGI